MHWMLTAIRRTLWMMAIAGIGGAVWTWQRDRTALPSPAGPPEWPPLKLAADTPVDDAAVTASPVDVAAWVEPDGGSCPISHPIKANDNSGIYHCPGGRFYDRTMPERCYATSDAAEADGYRAAKA